MTRIERITNMESLFDKSEEVVKRLEAALKDFEADEAGKLPKDLKRGVLSEDGIYDLLSDYQCLKDQIRTIEIE